MRWVTANRLAEISGYTEEAIRCKQKRGIWREHKHWRRAPDGRILFNVSEIERWIEGKAA